MLALRGRLSNAMTRSVPSSRALYLVTLVGAAVAILGACNGSTSSGVAPADGGQEGSTACTECASSGSGSAHDIAGCPNAYGMAPVDFYPYGAQPQGLACTTGDQCTIAIHDCPGDWPFGGLGYVNGYTCRCEAGAWSCSVTSPGAGVCPDFLTPDGGQCSCPMGQACAYAIADGCAATPSCQDAGAPHGDCNANTCACDGTIALSCTFVGPYATAPVAMPLQSYPCAGPDAGDAAP